MLQPAPLRVGINKQEENMTTEPKRLPYYCFKESGRQESLEARYWNTNGKGICIIAVITKGVDWAAYIGADNGYSEEGCLEWASRHGAKLSSKDAKHFFPEIELPYRL